MEEGEHVKHGLELWLGAFVEDFLRKLRVSLLDVLSQAIWRLSDDLECLLQDTKWELISWICCQPKAESWVWLCDIAKYNFKGL